MNYQFYLIKLDDQSAMHWLTNGLNILWVLEIIKSPTSSSNITAFFANCSAAKRTKL